MYTFFAFFLYFTWPCILQAQKHIISSNIYMYAQTDLLAYVCFNFNVLSFIILISSTLFLTQERRLIYITQPMKLQTVVYEAVRNKIEQQQKKNTTKLKENKIKYPHSLLLLLLEQYYGIICYKYFITCNLKFALFSKDNILLLKEIKK